MLKYKIDVLQALKDKGYSTYKLRQLKLIEEFQIQKIRIGDIASKEVLNTLCTLLQCQPGNLLEYVPDDTENNILHE